MAIGKEIQNFVGRIKIVGWIALFATLILLLQLNLIITTAWADLDINTQFIVFGITLTIVLALGFSRMGPEGFLKRKRRRRK